MKAITRLVVTATKYPNHVIQKYKGYNLLWSNMEGNKSTWEKKGVLVEPQNRPGRYDYEANSIKKCKAWIDETVRQEKEILEDE